MKIDQPCDTLDGGRRLVEANMSRPPNAKQLDVDSSEGIDFFLVLETELGHIFSGNFSIWNIDVFPGDINMVEKVEVHVVVVGFRVIIGNWEILVQIEGHHILEAQTFFLVHPDQLLIDSQGSAASGQTQYAGLPEPILANDFFLDDLGHSERCLS